MNEDRALAALIEITEDANENTLERINAAAVVLNHLDARRDREFAKSVTDQEQARPLCCGNLGHKP